MAENIKVQMQILRRDESPITVEAELNPVHADWLWDLFDVPAKQRGELLEMTVPISAVRVVWPQAPQG